jgi:hypothetical protein
MPCRKCDRAYADLFHLCSIDIVRPLEKRLWNGSTPGVCTCRTWMIRWCDTMASETLLGTTVQLAILTPIPNRKSLICR